MKCNKCEREIRHNWFPETFCWACDTTSKMPKSGSALPDEIKERNRKMEELE